MFLVLDHVKIKSYLFNKYDSFKTITIIAAGFITFSLVKHYWKRKRKKDSPKATCLFKTIFSSRNSSETELIKVKSSSKICMTNSDDEFNITQLSSSELSFKGFSCLIKSITFWEYALNTRLKSDTKVKENIQIMLNNAYKLRDHFEILFLSNESTAQQLLEHSTDDSYVSAEDDVADLKDFRDEYEALHFYKMNQKLLLESGIPCRILRTQFVKCCSDNDYLIKLQCIRIAFQHILKDELNKTWIIETMQNILSNLLIYGRKDPTNFLLSYADMVNFVSDTNNHSQIEEELVVRNVKMITFYDVALDYILLDAFEDLENPPSTVISVVQNQWLSNSIKETALKTAVWSVIKAKRCMLKYSDGFRSRFYTLSEQIIPFLAWGFLGPDEKLREMCNFFKHEMLIFFIEIFDFNKCRYTSLEDLSTDVYSMFQIRANNVSKKLLT